MLPSSLSSTTKAYLLLTAAGAALVALGTVLSTHPWEAAVVMVLVGVVIRFTGFSGAHSRRR